jgi:hypothetical protein
MAKILGAMAVVVAVMAFHQRPVQAKVAPWCAVLGIGKGAVYWGCQYRSFEDCYPHLYEGHRGFCNENPAYQGAAQPARLRASRRQRS